MPMPLVKDQVGKMVVDILGPSMKASGFRRRGRIFWRDGPWVCQVAAIVVDRWGSSVESSFDVRLGVFWHEVESVLENPSVGRMPPPEYRCTFRIGLAALSKKPPGPDWKVTTASDFRAIGVEVLAAMQGHGFGWFSYRSDVKHGLDRKRYLVQAAEGVYSTPEVLLTDAQVVFKVILGKKASAVADLKRSAKNGHAKSAMKLAERLRLPTREIGLADRGST